MYHSPIIHGGQSYDCSHLDPFVFSLYSQKVKKDLRIQVRFSDHCFTEAIYKGSRERIFNLIRWNLSFQLNAYIHRLTHPKLSVYQTAERRNWVHSITIESPQGPYHIFFELTRTPAHKRGFQDLELFVESAYPENPESGSPNVIGSMAFVILCGKTYLGEKIATRR